MGISFAAEASSSSSSPLPGAKCDSSYPVGGQLPYRINGTYVCGVSPFTDRAALDKCCAGPITNITEPAPTSGAYSDSWPLTCLAYCPVALKARFDGLTDTKAQRDFVACLTEANAFRSVVCTEVDGYAPNECVPFHQSVGCTDRLSHSTWDGSSFVSGSLSVSTTAPPSEATGGTALPSTEATSTTGAKGPDGTATPSSSGKDSVAWRIKPVGLLRVAAAAMVIQAVLL